VRRIILLHGAVKNAGDFLIRERGAALLRQVHPSASLIEMSRRDPLDPSVLSPDDLVVLCGGPAYRPEFYPGIYALSAPLERLPCRIAPWGLGLGVGFRGENLSQFAFTQDSRSALALIHSRLAMPSSARDDLTTATVARAANIALSTTGCPAWFFLPDIEKIYTPPTRVGTVAVTTPAAPELFTQAISLLRTVAHRYRKSARHVVFHRGIFPDRNTSLLESAASIAIATAARALGYRVHDASYGAGGTALYATCDLHVGYRVHAHIDFLSRRKPSILLCEDVRGMGQCATLGTAPISAHSTDAIQQLVVALDSHESTRFAQFEAPVERMRTGYEQTIAYLSRL
jgi:hypothetical protein